MNHYKVLENGKQLFDLILTAEHKRFLTNKARGNIRNLYRKYDHIEQIISDSLICRASLATLGLLFMLPKIALLLV